MTHGGRIAGGILAIIGAALVLVAGLAWIIRGFASILPVPAIGAIIWGILGLVGGIMLIQDKNAGGILALIGGIGDVAGVLVGMAYFTAAFGLGFIIVDPFLILVGGILGLVFKAEV